MQEVLDLAKQEQGSLSVEDVYQIFRALSHLHMEWVLNFSKDFSRLADSKPLHFDGDVVVTDPCCFMRDPAPGAKNDWSACDYGRKLDLFGIEGLKKIPRQGGHYAYEVTDRAKFHRWYDDLLNEYLDEMERDPIKERGET